MFPGLRNSAFAVFLVPDSHNKMPDVDSYDSSSGIAVDVQQRLNCALPSFSLSFEALSRSKVFTAYPTDDQLIHPKGLAVDLCLSAKLEVRIQK